MANKKLPEEKKKQQLQVGVEKYKIDVIGLDNAQNECKEHLERVYKKFKKIK